MDFQITQFIWNHTEITIKITHVLFIRLCNYDSRLLMKVEIAKEYMKLKFELELE